ncbi:MAG: sulfide/dihydroorotate dehydrogenase-like FAD/NAD-binding protein [Ruminococcaceae bacterium]|nr:sulfide/dihydroorotate dehydrogenase-like FAD/NAD-binding protein [Oscillospiraceae bacterium]
MCKITLKKALNNEVVKLSVYAPLIAKKAKAGQFIILRPFSHSERIPLTIAKADTQSGEITVIFQKVGKTTMELDTLNVGDSINDFVGPLGNPTKLDGIKKAAVIGGGLGCAIALPIAEGLYKAGAEVHMIAGFRNKDIVILEDEMKNSSNELFVCTDDGSYGTKGFVTDKLKELIEAGEEYDCVFAIGPLPMMKFVSMLTKEFGIKTIVSMNPIMIDGTGMCGGCRVTVGKEIKFACVDGPDFDGHLVDFDETIARNNAYKQIEKDKRHSCRMEGFNRA